MEEIRADLTAADGFTHWATDTVRFSDQDSVGHVNNVAIAAYLETGRVAFGREVLKPLLPSGARFTLAHHAIDYRRESHWPGQVRIGSRLVRVGTSSLTVGSGVFRDGTCIATGTAVIVHVGEDGSAPLGNEIRSRLEDLLPR